MVPAAARLANSLPGDLTQAALVPPGRAAALGDGLRPAADLAPAESGSGARAVALQAGSARVPSGPGTALVPPPAPGASGAAS